VRQPLLDEHQVIDVLAADDGPDWHLIGGKLVKTVVCATFVDALAFVGRVGALAEAADHHPDIDIRWDTVTLRLSTHSAGGLTEKDLSLAAEIDELG
jgi:4a-hydroxytetrahydrobiopterin dehydratase